MHRHLVRGYTDVVDADLSRYFDSIPHSDLMQSVARRVVDKEVLRLTKMWLKAPVVDDSQTDRDEPKGGGKRGIA